MIASKSHHQIIVAGCPILAKQGWGADKPYNGLGISPIPHPSQKAKDGAPP